MSNYEDLKILIVDDSPVDRQILKAIVENTGGAPYTAADGIEALDLIRRVEPDIVLTDVIMPRMDGVELLNKIGELDRYIPTILLTGRAEQNFIVECLEAGADDFFLKPYNPVILGAKLRALSNLIHKINRTKDNFDSILTGLHPNEPVYIEVNNDTRSIAIDLINIFEKYAKAKGYVLSTQIDSFNKGMIKIGISTTDSTNAGTLSFDWRRFVDCIFHNKEMPPIPYQPFISNQNLLIDSIRERFDTLRLEVENLKNDKIFLQDTVKNLSSNKTRITIHNSPEGNNVKLNGTFNHCTIAKRVESVSYSEDLGEMRYFAEAKRIISKLEEEQVNEIKKISEELDVEQGVSDFLSKHGISIAQNLVSSGLFQMIASFVRAL